ncbi:MAG TPA: pyridoxal phosphate-dependent aminotransferase [Myxococcota bacterium]|jgi:aspartate/methionine/tyrosine aminotransferase|nr:pyridoxal phosphate-dependent aminotransferase [Myxococcota bacterium]
MPSPPARLARRTAEVEPFLAMEVTERAMALEREGRSVIRLGVGEPDFPPPPEAVEACARALAAGETGYTDSRGLLELREAIARDHARRGGVSVDPERVLVTNGVSSAMLLVFALLVDEGDEVILGTPHYPCYPNFVRVFGGRPVYVPTRAEDGFRLDPEAVRRALSPRTRAIVVASPANPTGAVQDAATMRALSELGVPLVSDEIYDGLVYDGVRCTSALGLSDDAYVLDGFSKRYAMTGFRLGYVISPAHAARPIQVLQQNLFICANRFVQHAGVAALAHGAKTLEAMRAAYALRRTLLVEGLRRLGFSVPRLPEGAFYVFADARPFGALGADSRRLAFDLLERSGVAATPGVDFGPAGEGFLRFCYAAPEAAIGEALERLARALPRP